MLVEGISKSQAGIDNLNELQKIILIKPEVKYNDEISAIH